MTIVNKYEALILDLAEVPRLGVTASLAVENMVREACDRHLAVFIVGAQGKVRERLSALHVFDGLPPENLLASRLQALQQATDQLNSLGGSTAMSTSIPSPTAADVAFESNVEGSPVADKTWL